MCIKSNGGEVIDEYVNGDFAASVTFFIYSIANITADGAAEAYKPLNDLSAYFRKNGTEGLNLGDRRIPDDIRTLSSPKDIAGKDEDGSIIFVAVYQLTYDETK